MLRDIAPCDDARSPSLYSPTRTWPRSCMIAANGRGVERGTDGRAQAQSRAGDEQVTAARVAIHDPLVGMDLWTASIAMAALSGLWLYRSRAGVRPG